MIQAARLAEATRIFAVIPPLQKKVSEYEDGAFANAKSRRGNIAQVCLTAGVDLIDVTPHRLEDKTKEDFKLWARRIADTIRSEYPNHSCIRYRTVPDRIKQRNPVSAGPYLGRNFIPCKI